MYSNAVDTETELMDVVGHQCDQAYTVPGIAALVAAAGMTVNEFVLAHR
jgi:hypothetical protein